MSPVEVIAVGGYPVRKTTTRELSAMLIERIPRRTSTALFFANTNLIMQCRALLPQMLDDRVIVVNDGVGLSLAAALFHGDRFRENLNGTDFVPHLLSRTGVPMRVYLIGGKPAVLERAVGWVRDRLGQTVVGAAHGYRDLDNAQLIDEIRDAAPDVILVALGNPLQEAWILRHRKILNVGVLIGVGALFDFWAGEKPRAPRLVRTLRLEWLFRLLLEPRRLFRRYTVDVMQFLWTCYRQRQ